MILQLAYRGGAMRTKTPMEGVCLTWAVFMLGSTAIQAADISYNTNITSGVFNGGSAFTVGNTTNGITVTVSGGAITNGSGRIGPNAANVSNTVIVTGSGVWSNSSTLTIGSAGAFSGLVVSNGGTVYAVGPDSAILGGSSSSSNNWALVTGAGSMWTNIAGTFWVGKFSDGNTLTVSNNGTFYAPTRMDIIKTNNTVQVMNGGKFFVAGIFNIGHTGSSNAAVLVSGAGAVLQASGGVNLGAEGSGNAINSRLIVTNGGVFLNNTGTLYVGGRGSKGAVAVVTGSGSMIDGTGNLYFGYNGALPGTNGILTILDGGLVKANGAAGLQFYGLNNVLTNNGGILQFSVAAPTLTGIGTAGAVVMTNATLSYCDIQSGTLPNLTNNWGTTSAGKFIWEGSTNTFRLNNSIATNSLGRPYLFSSLLGQTNYARLEMINGTTAIRGSGLTVSNDCSVLFSNTTALIYGTFTNNGTMTVADSIVTFSNGCTMGENSTVYWSTNTASSNLISVASGTLKLPANMTLNVTGWTATQNAVLFNAPGGVSGSPDGWTVVPAAYCIRKEGNSLILGLQNGTMFLFN